MTEVTDHNSSPGTAVTWNPVIPVDNEVKNQPKSNENIWSLLQQKGYHSSMSDGNQSTASTKRDESGRQGMDLIPKPTDNGTRQDEDHRNKVSGQKRRVS